MRALPLPFRLSALMVAPLALAACATTTPTPVLPRYAAVDVPMVRETDPVGTVNADAADDPAIWRNPADPARSWIVGTDKKAGLYSYGLDGHRRAFIAAGELNNVDLRDGVRWGGRDIILAGASDRTDRRTAAIAFFALDPATGGLTALGSASTGTPGEAYGFCFGRKLDGVPLAYVVAKDGTVSEYAVDGSGAAPRVILRRQFRVATQPEGCVVDDRTNQFYLGEEDVGIWRFDLDTAQPQPIAFATVGAEDGLVADVEGLALAPVGARGGSLVASSQGDSAYVLFDLETGRMTGRFRIGGAGSEATSDTDGIELALGDFGPDFPQGLLVVQDGDNAPDAQNFKLISWERVLEALRR
jgi:3-phytase